MVTVLSKGKANPKTKPKPKPKATIEPKELTRRYKAKDADASKSKNAGAPTLKAGKVKLHAHIILDASGSMAPRQGKVCEAINTYVKEVASDKGTDAEVSLTVFNSDSWGTKVQINTVVDRAKARAFPRLDGTSYQPSGMTPLNDAIGHVVSVEKQAKRRKDERVALVIMTDGLENVSKEYTTDAVKKLLADRQREDNWLVIYLGANQDAISVGQARGVGPDTSMTFSEDNYITTMSLAAASTMRYAGSGDRSKAKFSDKERSSVR